MAISSQQCISAGLLYLLLFTSAVCFAAPTSQSTCLPQCTSWQTNTTAREVYSGLNLMLEMGRTLPTGTPMPTANVSVMDVTEPRLHTIATSLHEVIGNGILVMVSALQ